MREMLHTGSKAVKGTMLRTISRKVIQSTKWQHKWEGTACWQKDIGSITWWKPKITVQWICIRCFLKIKFVDIQQFLLELVTYMHNWTGPCEYTHIYSTLLDCKNVTLHQGLIVTTDSVFTLLQTHVNYCLSLTSYRGHQRVNWDRWILGWVPWWLATGSCCIPWVASQWSAGRPPGSLSPSSTDTTQTLTNLFSQLFTSLETCFCFSPVYFSLISAFFSRLTDYLFYNWKSMEKWPGSHYSIVRTLYPGQYSI